MSSGALFVRMTRLTMRIRKTKAGKDRTLVLKELGWLSTKTLRLLIKEKLR